MEWEKIYVAALMESLHPFGDVLQVGFRSNFVANEIHKYLPRSHVLIESHAPQIPDAKEWAKKHGAVFEEMAWRQALPRLGVFDTIFFAGSNEETPLWALEAKGVAKEIEAQIPQLTKMRYTDADLEPFCKASAKEAPESLYRFLHELEQNGQISKEQKEKMIKKFHLKKGPEVLPIRKKHLDVTFVFLKECLTLHMRKGSRFSCFLEDPTSKYEDPRFVDEIIANPWVDYREKTVSIPQKGEVLILVVEKLG